MSRKVFDRTPPHNIEAEQAVLGCCLLNPDVIDGVVALIGRPGLDAFYHDGHEMVFSALRAVHDSSAPVDLVTLGAEMERAGTLDQFGGYLQLGQLTDAVPTSANWEHYAGLVRDAALLRSLIKTCTAFASEGYRGETDAAILIDRAGVALDGLSCARAGSGAVSLSVLVPGAHAGIMAIMEGTAPRGITTGIQELDRLLNGLQGQDVIVLAASPSVGKTAFALNVSLAAARTSRRVLLFSAEMSSDKITQRLICAAGRVDMQKLRSGFLARSQVPRLKAAVDELSQLPISIDDTPSPSISMLRSVARGAARAHGGIDLIVIDYLQLLEADGRHENENERVATLSKAVKGLARELNAAVLCLSQISREGAKSGSADLFHLRGSGAIEQDADVVVMLSKIELENGGGDGLRIDVKKQRNGPTGQVIVAFCKTEQWIGDLEYREPERQMASFASSVDVEYDYDEQDEELF